MTQSIIIAIEEWHPVVGWEERYEVSSLGRVRSLGYIDHRHAGKYIKIRRDNNGYLVVRFYKNSKSYDRTVHSVVAEAFIGLRPEGMVVNHKDGNKENPLPQNLEYVTVGENNLHAFRVLGRIPVRPFGKRKSA